MNIIFTTINKPETNTEIKKIVYNGTEKAFQDSFTERLNKIEDKLMGIDINIEIDFQSGTARFFGDDISDEQIKFIKEILHQE